MSEYQATPVPTPSTERIAQIDVPTRTDIPNDGSEVVLEANVQAMYYSETKAVRDVFLPFHRQQVTALIGPSGCGKTTVLRCLNRMNDVIRGFRLEGEVRFFGKNIYDESTDPVAVRRHIGMVFQQPNPFAMTIFQNVAFGLKLNGYQGGKAALAQQVEEALRSASLWDEVKDKLGKSGLSLSGGQQQRLCIARAIATRPPILLMDEPCSALDPISTRRVEELINELKRDYTIIIVTHNMQQAQRVSDSTAFFYVDTSDGGRTGYLVEHEPTKQLFEHPKHELTAKYIGGEFS